MVWQLPVHQNVADRDLAIKWARAMVADDHAVYLDTETTGLKPGSEIVELAIIDNAGRALLDTLIRPQRPIPRDSSAIHGIFDSDVSNAPNWESVYSSVLEIVRNRRVVVYNREYDRGIIDALCRESQLDLLPGKWKCSMIAFGWLHGEWDDRFNHYRWHRLDNVTTSLGIPGGGHRARSDADCSRQVVHHMAGYPLSTEA